MAAVSANSFADAPQPERHVQDFLKVLNSGSGKPIEQLSPQDARQVPIGAQKGAKLPAADVTEKTINVDGGTIKLNIVKPHNARGTLPVFMFFHGGGWILGDFVTHERLVRDLVTEPGAAAVFVNYTLSAEAHFPVALQAKQHNAPAIRYEVMLLPVTGARFNTASYDQYENGYFLSRNMMT